MRAVRYSGARGLLFVVAASVNVETYAQESFCAEYKEEVKHTGDSRSQKSSKGDIISGKGSCSRSAIMCEPCNSGVPADCSPIVCSGQSLSVSEDSGETKIRSTSRLSSSEEQSVTLRCYLRPVDSSAPPAVPTTTALSLCRLIRLNISSSFLAVRLAHIYRACRCVVVKCVTRSNDKRCMWYEVQLSGRVSERSVSARRHARRCGQRHHILYPGIYTGR
ncbi:hypothetical protein J6590_065034 [Homalodisca vitripennis]|nr:hypothetical protein J6590_065034 [Homalodisca vitripennis]